MTSNRFVALEERVERLLHHYSLLKRENERLAEENRKLTAERDEIRSRIDVMLQKLEGL